VKNSDSAGGVGVSVVDVICSAKLSRRLVHVSSDQFWSPKTVSMLRFQKSCILISTSAACRPRHVKRFRPEIHYHSARKAS
jgi:hypothetical protein